METSCLHAAENLTLMQMYVPKPVSLWRMYSGQKALHQAVNTMCMFTITRSIRSDALKTQQIPSMVSNGGDTTEYSAELSAGDPIVQVCSFSVSTRKTRTNQA